MIKIIKNFLDKEDFLHLQKYLLSEDLPWYYRKSMILNSKDSPYFTYCFFNDNEITSNNFNLVKPILDKLNSLSIIQIRANLVLKEEKTRQCGWHCDYGYKNFKTAILYINQSNGPTLIKNNESSVLPEENKILIMDGNTEHALVTQTDTRRRVVLNLNYYEK
jgi:hypothetical protein|tara:strand:- start:697 stop:1185 length:489 start_codon:yes stop_codon:yes gene_type:complete